MNIRLAGTALLLSSLALAGCATGPGYGGGYNNGGYNNGGYNNGGYNNNGGNCYDCGTVTRIEQGTGSRTPQATGGIIGGVIGAVAGREITRSQTDSEGRKNAGTIAGAAAGAAIGNAVQNRVGMGYNIYIRMADGRETVVSQDDLRGIREGSYVRVQNGRATLN